jgi:hypothetical protein
MGKMERRRKLPCVCRLRTFYGARVVGDTLQMSMGEKSDEEGKKEQRKGERENPYIKYAVSAFQMHCLSPTLP